MDKMIRTLKKNLGRITLVASVCVLVLVVVITRGNADPDNSPMVYELTPSDVTIGDANTETMVFHDDGESVGTPPLHGPAVDSRAPVSREELESFHPDRESTFIPLERLEKDENGKVRFYKATPSRQ